MASAESFTVLAILEARDAASEIFDKVDESLDRFSETAKGAADSARESGEAIDESLTQTASGADALSLASARVEAAQARQAQTAKALADAERDLLSVTGQEKASDDEVAAAADAVTAAQDRAAASAKTLKDAQASLRAAAGDEDALAAAADRVAIADREAAQAANDLATAQARQASLNTDENAIAAAQGLAKAEKAARAASDDLAASQGRQADVQKAVAASDTEAAAAAEEQAAAQKDAADKAAATQDVLGKAGKVAGITALGMGIAAAVMVKAAGNFQDSTEHLVTDAGESQKNLAMVQAGILRVSTATGQSASDITNAMYHIESSGFHASTGLAILKTAAEGARVGGADLDTTSKALVGTMTAYYGTSLTAGQATKDSTSLMNQLVETVGSGDMRLQDLASSLSAVTPVAAAAHISFSQVGGAIATMTAQGMSAQQTTQDLAHFIRSLQAPTLVSSNEMKALGLNANSLSQNLGKTGLAGTISEMRDAILRNTSGGSVMLGYLKEMSPAAQSLSNQILSGTISTGDLTTAVKGLNPEQAHLITMFKGAATSATGLKQTYTEAMSKMAGGATGLNVALMLSGKHMSDLTKNTAAIAARAKDASGNVQGWSTIQSTFNFKLSQAKTGVENTGIAIGTALLPAVTALLSGITKIVIPIAEWTAKHKTLTEILFVGVTAIAATVAILVVARKAFDAVKGAVDTVKATLRGLGLIAKETGEKQETAATKAATVQESESAEASAAMETDAAEVATANETAAAESSGSWATSAGQMITSAAKWVVQSAVKVAQVVASYAVAAAQAVAGWAVAGAQMIAQGAIWVAQTVAKVAIVVGSNIAAAATTAAAWVIANAAMLLGIGLIVVAVVAAVALIVTHWKQVSAFAKKAFDDVLHIVDTVIGWVKSHWPLLLAILTGPFGLAVLFITTHWKQVTKAVSEAIDWVKAHWPLLLAILTGPVGLAVLFVVKHFDQIRDGAASLIGDLVRFFESLPGRVLSVLGNLGSMLFGLGAHIISMLASGITSAIGDVTSAIGSVGGEILDHIPHSPAKKGPLSGSGSPDIGGRKIAQMLAQGLLAGTGDVTAASAHLAGAAALGRGGSAGGGLTALGSGAGAAAGGATIVIDVHGNYIMSDSDINLLVRKLGPALTTALGQAGVKVRMG